MPEPSANRRDVLRGVGALGATGLLASPAAAADVVEPEVPSTPLARATYRAVVDAVVPRTPELASELGDAHVPGGLDVGLDEYLVTFVDSLFTVGSAGDLDGNLPLSEPVAILLDVAALKLVALGANEEPPKLDRVLELLDVDDLLAVDELSEDPELALQQSLFAGLSREDRLQAIEQLDAIDVDTAFLPGPVAELDAGLIGQLFVGFVEVIYYSEWQGYEDLTAPPSEREFSGEDVQSWDQTEFPGIIDGAAALRGYLSAPGSDLGEGATWDTVDVGGGEPLKLRADPGQFAEDDYDTSDYAEVFSTDGTPATEGPVDAAIAAVTGDASAAGGSGNPLDDSLDGLLGFDLENPVESLYRDVIRGLLEVDR
jgi:hypothetical protein